MPKPPETSSERLDDRTPKWNLIIDVANSVHANNCVLAAKDEYVGNDHPGYCAPIPEEGGDIVWVDRKVRGETPVVDTSYLLQMCNHCDNGPCQKVGGDAVTKRPDGIVIIDPIKAKGRKDIVQACPFGAVIWNEELQLPQHWIFDAHLLDAGWPHPRFVDVSPKGAVEAVKISDAEMQERAREERLEVLKPHLGTRPRVYYKNLYRFTSCFVGGALVIESGGGLECVEGADVHLSHDGKPIASTLSDAFGEFRFDGLEPGSGAYSLSASHPEAGTASAEVEIAEESVVLKDWRLTN